MLNKKYLPTPLIEKKKQKKVQIVENLNSDRFSIFYIIWRLIIFFSGVQWRKIINKSDPKKTATQLREIFEELGGFWVKTGQLLALRSDLFSEEICDQLIRLQYGALGFPVEIVRSTIESEYGVPLEKVFDDFDEEPLAAASIAQIHTAVLRNKKTRVIVKVQRPGLEQAFKRDLNLIKLFIKVLIILKIGGSYLRLEEAVSELEQIFDEELDYRYEASNARRMKKTLKDHDIYVPKIYDKYSKRRVLVMEYIDGVLMSDYINVYQNDRAKLRKWEDENNVDAAKIGEQLYLSLFRQALEDNLYHADLHPGNIILLRDSKLVLIDMGSVGSLDKDLRTNYLNYTRALSNEDYAKAADYYIRFAVDIPKVNMPAVRAEMARGFEMWSAQSKLKGLDFKEKSLGRATSEVSKVSIKYGIPTNWAFLKLTRSFLTLDGSIQFLLEDFDLFKILKKNGKQSERRASNNNFQLENITQSVNEFFTIVDEYNNLILPQIRNQAVPFEVTTNIFALSLIVILRTLSLVLLISEVSIFYGFLYQQYFEITKPIHLQVADEIVSQLPYIPYLEWVGILILIFFVIRALLACATILERKEYKGIGS